MIENAWIESSFSGAEKETTCQDTRVALRRTLAHRYDAPSQHDPAHPHIRAEVLQHESSERLQEHVWVVEDAQSPCPLRRGHIPELLLDSCSLLEVHDSSIRNVADMDTHDQVHKRIPAEQMLIDFPVSGLKVRSRR